MLSLAHHMPFPAMMLADECLRDVAYAVHHGSRISCEQPNVEESEDAYTVTVRAPGVKPGDLAIEAFESRLIVKGETTVGGGSHNHFVNYSVGLPQDANVDAASAGTADGLVTVTVPKKPKAEPARITVNAKPADDDCSRGDECPCGDGETNCGTSKPYHLTVVAPGVAAADLALNVEEGNVLVVTGATAKTGASIDRRYRLPRDVDVEKATAAHVDGELTITLPKKSTPASRSIAIGVHAATDDKDEDGVMV